MTFGHRKELIKIGHDRIKARPDKYVDHIYGELEAGGTSWLYLSGVPFGQLDYPTNLPRKPIVENTRGFLSAVPLVLTLWPALLGLCYTANRNKEEKG